MSLVTYLPRVLPVVILSRMDLPDWFVRWLRYIPVAVLSALLAPSVLMQNGKIAFTLQNKALLTSIPCILIAVKSRNLFLTVSSGIAVMFLLNLL